jgi:hypothetical protein
MSYRSIGLRGERVDKHINDAGFPACGGQVDTIGPLFGRDIVDEAALPWKWSFAV